MGKKEIAKTIKNGVITGMCTAMATIAASKLCEATDQVIEKIEFSKQKKTLEDIFAEE